MSDDAGLPLTLIAAVALNGIIGLNNRMPWRLPGDMAHFRRATAGQPVLMGRRTYESIGRALPGRPTIVVSQSRNFRPPDADVAPDLASAITQATRRGRDIGADQIMVAGGGAIYAASIGGAATLVITAVDLEPPGDTAFPAIDRAQWREIERIAAVRRDDDDASYTFVRYRRYA